ncbi:MAG TPA: hypothetical protein VK515_08535, partial [Rhizomicrobium sp.]|nr:hypothetical protein [Rhizomicrobium sp.]
PFADTMTQVLACTGAVRNRRPLKKCYGLLRAWPARNGEKQGFQHQPPAKLLKDFHRPATRFLTANIETYRDGEGCGIRFSGYAPVRPFGSRGEFFRDSTEG